MSIADNKLKKLLESSPLFADENKEHQSLNLDALTEKQAISLARKGRTNTAGTGKIAGGMTKRDLNILSQAGTTLAEKPEIITSNVQRNKEWRRDPRTLGGEKTLAKKMEAPTRQPLPEMPDMPALPDVPVQQVAAGIAPTGIAAMTQIGKMGLQGVSKEAIKSATSGATTNIGGGLTGSGGSFLNATAAAGLGTIGADSIVAQTAAQSAGMHPSLFGAPSLANEMIALGPSSGLPGAASASTAAGMTAGQLLPLAGFALQAYNILNMGGVFGGKGKKGGPNYEQLLRKAEAGEKSHVSDLRGGKITWDLTDEATLDYIRGKFVEDLKHGTNPYYRALRQQRGEDYGDFDVAGKSKQEILDMYKQRQTESRQPKKDLWGKTIEWQPEEDYHGMR